MSLRQIVLDTETTGMRVEDGHRVIEIGCVELIDRKLTGRHYHTYLNPQTAVEMGALAVHGISNQFLQDKPIFQEIVQDFTAFIHGAELIIHNAPFDVSFLNNEFVITQHTYQAVTDICRVIDTLKLARELHVGQRNNLDALCKRYNIDNSKRDLHGALLDANLLAQVYLAMTGGQGSFFDALSEQSKHSSKRTHHQLVSIKKNSLVIVQATAEELAEHQKYLQKLNQQSGQCMWLVE